MPEAVSGTPKTKIDLNKVRILSWRLLRLFWARFGASWTLLKSPLAVLVRLDGVSAWGVLEALLQWIRNLLELS